MNKKGEPSEVSHPHDTFNRKWFGDPEVAADVLRVVVPDSLKPWIAPEKLKLEPVSFIDEWQRSTQSDLLWSCIDEDEGGEIRAFFYVLWEHQSQVDPWMTLRMFCYMARIWERWWLGLNERNSDNRRAEKKLPLIFPMVLYQGEPEWRAATSLGELVDDLPEDLRAFFPDFRFHLETLRTRPDVDFPPGLAQLGISVLKLMWDEDFVSWLQRFEAQLLELHGQGRADKLEALLLYAFTQVERSRKPEFIGYLNQHLSPMVTKGNSVYDALIEEGMEKGREETLRAMVRNMRENGMTAEEISRVGGLEVAEVERFLEED